MFHTRYQYAPHTFEGLASSIQGLVLSHLFEQLLHHHVVMDASITDTTRHRGRGIPPEPGGGPGEGLPSEPESIIKTHPDSMATSPGINLYVIVAGYAGNLQFFLRRCLQNTTLGILASLIGSSGTCHESHVLHSQLLYTTAIQLPQDAHDASLLASPRWAMYQQVWQIPTLHLHNTPCLWSCFKIHQLTNLPSHLAWSL